VCEAVRGLEMHWIVGHVQAYLGGPHKKMRQYMYFCNSKCVSICTFVLVNASHPSRGWLIPNTWYKRALLIHAMTVAVRREDPMSTDTLAPSAPPSLSLLP
jgi:hypothetical protein